MQNQRGSPFNSLQPCVFLFELLHEDPVEISFQGVKMCLLLCASLTGPSVLAGV